MKHPAEIYLKLFRSLCQPSAGIFLCCWTAVITAQQPVNGFHTGVICGAASASLLFAAAGIIFTLKTGRGREDKAIRVAVFILLVISISLSAFYRASPPAGDELPALKKVDPAETSYRIIADRKGRYSREILFQQLTEDRLKGIAYIPPESQLKINDIIVSDFTPEIINSPGEELSPFDRQRLRRGITFTLRLYDGTFEVTSGEPTLRNRITRKLEKALDSTYPEDTSAFLKALYFGNNSYIHKEKVDTFKRAGVMHVLAASGLHVGIVVLIPFAAARIFRIRSRAVFAAAVILLSCYLFIAGAPVSLTRAFIMFSVFALQKIFFLNSDSLNALFLTGITVLLLNPAEALMPGFLLSFGATFGILAFYRLYQSSFEKLPGFIASSFALTMSAQLAAVPVILIFMKEINLTGIISNLVVIPVTAVILASSVFLKILWFIAPEISVIAGSILDSIRAILDRFTTVMAETGWHFSAVEISPLLILLLFLMNLQLIPVKKGRHFLAAAPFVCTLMLWFFLSYPVTQKSELTVYKHSYGRTAVFIEANRAVIAGDLPEFNKVREIYSDLAGRGVSRCVLVIDRPVYPSISGFSYLARNMVVERCLLSSDFDMYHSVINFFNVLSVDSVEPELKNFSSPCEGGKAYKAGSPEYVRKAARCARPDIDYTGRE